MYGQTHYAGPVLLALFTACFVLWHVGLSKIFQKAGREGFKAFVPVLNIIELYKIIGRPTWQVVYWFIPIVNVFAFINSSIDLYRSFGKAFFQEYAVGILFPYYYTVKLGFSPKEKYQGQGHTFPRHQKTQIEEWRDSILFAVLAATLIRWMVMELYMIPTPSMEKSLLVGDYLFVSKLHYGPRTPQTPIQLPFTHQYMWGSRTIPSYLDWLQLPMYRLPSLQEVERYDAVVFNYPNDKDFPADLRTHYIKRCIGMPGDSLKIIDRQVYIDGKQAVNAPKLQWFYTAIADHEIEMKVFHQYGILSHDVQYHPGYDMVGYKQRPDGKLEYQLFTVPSVLQEMKAAGILLDYSFYDMNNPAEKPALFPNSMVSLAWTLDNYGSIWIPKKGATIQINYASLKRYGSTIQDYEGWDKVEIRDVKGLVHGHEEVVDQKLFINGIEVKEYTFQKNYYFMMGDNRHNSLDSRFWGYVPDDHIVGKALFILISFDPDRSGFKGIRWNRMFNLID